VTPLPVTRLFSAVKANGTHEPTELTVPVLHIQFFIRDTAVCIVLYYEEPCV